MPERIIFMGNKHKAVAVVDPADGSVDLTFTAQTGGETIIGIPEDLALGEAFNTITAPGGVWDGQARDFPTWVQSTDWPSLATLLGEHYQCEVR